MKLALSTNWCNRRLVAGEAIADEALALGFDALELGFHTSVNQVPGFKRRLDQMPVGSIHAFCPVPLSAPQGYPELYTLATLDEDARGLARFHVTRNIEFAAEMGAETVVLHAGRVPFSTFFRRGFSSHTLRLAMEKAKGDRTARAYQKLLAKARKMRTVRGQKILEVFKAELTELVPVLEKHGVVLALENLPYLEGFPNEDEMAQLVQAFKGAPIKAWFDTGHHRVRDMFGWIPEGFDPVALQTEPDAVFRGMHLNDVVDFNDDHLPPGEGRVDFAALKPLAERVRHIVVEPNAGVTPEALAKGLAHARTTLLPHVVKSCG